MIVVLEKNPWNPGSQSIFHELNIYIYISNIYLFIIYNKWSFLQNNNYKAVKKMEWIKIEKYGQKTVGILFMCGCMCVSVCSVCAYACTCYSYIWMRVFIRLSQATNAALWVSGLLPLEKAWTLLSPGYGLDSATTVLQEWFLALNNPRRLTSH